MSRRMGRAKLLLPWTEEETILEHILMQLLLARINHITVVTGHCAAKRAALRGNMTSTWCTIPGTRRAKSCPRCRRGLASLPANIGGALVLLGDQPRVTRASSTRC